VCGPLEADPEYQLIVEANNVTVEIDNEISKFYDVWCTIHCLQITCTLIFVVSYAYYYGCESIFD